MELEICSLMYVNWSSRVMTTLMLTINKRYKCLNPGSSTKPEAIRSGCISFPSHLFIWTLLTKFCLDFLRGRQSYSNITWSASVFMLMIYLICALMHKSFAVWQDKTENIYLSNPQSRKNSSMCSGNSKKKKNVLYIWLGPHIQKACQRINLHTSQQEKDKAPHASNCSLLIPLLST